MKLKLSQLIEALSSAPPERAHLYVLSNLTREEVSGFQSAWEALPTPRRQQVVDMLVDIAEKDFEVNFNAIFRMALVDTDPLVRQRAVEGLWEDKDIRLISHLVRLLAEDDAPQVRAAAATSLGRFMLMGELGKIRPDVQQRVYDALLKTCQAKQEPTEVNRRAMESISYSGKEEIANLIQEAYRHPDERMRVSAIFSMGRSADEQWADCVIAELRNANPEMRYEAARACGELALERALFTLIEMVEDVDFEVQEAAIWALGQIGGDEARRVLNTCVEGDNEAKRAAALAALRELEFLHGDLGAMLFPIDTEDEDEDDL